MPEAVLRLRSVFRNYGELPVLKGVDLDVARGELVVIRGQSGSGKSTLLHLMGLMDAPDEGEVLHSGKELARASEVERAQERLRGIGFVFQRCYLVPTLSATRNVALPLRAAGLSPTESVERANALLESVGLRGREEHFPHQLSGGQQQLVAVARALANRPYLVLADEPTGELDPESGARVMQILGRATREHDAGVVLVTHAPATAPSPARHLALRDGKLEAA